MTIHHCQPAKLVLLSLASTGRCVVGVRTFVFIVGRCAYTDFSWHRGVREEQCCEFNICVSFAESRL